MATVLLGMSGGLDSSMSAYFLLQQGYNVIGATMAVWDENYYPLNAQQNECFKGGCFGPSEVEDIAKAKKVCKKFGIEHHVIDLKQQYGKIVLDYFKDSYLKGLTPNPCIMCNQKIKFDLIPGIARQNGLDFDYYATGHYVRVEEQENNLYICKGLDKGKDQSYFLCRLQQQQIEKVKFPLGAMPKDKVRELARQLKMDFLADQKESQDFIDSSDYSEIFCDRRHRKGKIMDREGNVLGEHRGIIFYTVGKRRGLNISGLKEPYYVTSIDAKNNVIYAGPKQELYHKKLIAENIVWVDGHKRIGQVLTGKIRLHHNPAECVVTQIEDDKYEVEFVAEQKAITPGQVIAFYKDDLVLGGGFIVAVG